MSDTFSLGGDPGSIRASGQSWKSFASSASSASSDIKSVDAASFQGDEGDTYRGKVNDDLPPRLDKTHEAWEQVGSALITYASTLEDLQSRLATLKTQHDSASQTASAKANDLESAKSADKTHDQQQTEAKSKLKPGETLPPSTYSSGASGAQSQLNEANNAVQDTINKANQVHSEHRTALNTCCNQIEDAKGKRFEKPPGFWGKLKDSVVDWVKDHADVLKQISGVLKIISAIAGVLSFIPILTPIMGPIALVTGGAALLIDVGLKLITGEGSWASIGIDAATMLLPGAGKLIGKGIKGVVGAERVASVGNRVRTSVNGSRAVTALRNSRAVNGISRANRAFENAALRVPGVRAANVRAGRLGANTPTRFNNIADAMAHARPRLQNEADQAWNQATARSDPNYFRNPAAEGPRTRYDRYLDGHGGSNPSAATQGTWAHTDLERSLTDHPERIFPSSSNYEVRPEVSYGPSGEVPRGTSGSARPDVVIGRNDGPGWTPEAAQDLKTGQAGITDRWREKVADRSGIESGNIEELRPGGGGSGANTPSSGNASSSGGTAAWSTPVLPMPSLFSGGS